MRRVFAGIAVATIGSLIALLLGSGTIPPCLGLDVTAVRCAEGTGVTPIVGAATPMVLVALLLGALVVWPPQPSRRPALLGGAGLLLGIAFYLLTRPTVLEGPDLDGTWLSIPLPIERVPFLAWAVAGGLAGLLLGSVTARGRGRNIPGQHRRSLAGVLRDRVGRVPADESWESLRDAAWAAPDPERLQ